MAKGSACMQLHIVKSHIFLAHYCTHNTEVHGTLGTEQILMEVYVFAKFMEESQPDDPCRAELLLHTM